MSSDELSSSDDASDESTTWISWFCSLRGNEFFCVVEDEYIADGFNLAGLKEEIPYYDFAMETIMDSEQSETDNLTESQQEQVDSAAELLYGLIHARFIITSKGLALMNDKFLEGHFGQCSNYFCQKQNLLPVGLHDQPRKAYVYLFCPRCNGVFSPRSSRHANIDGAYFGTTFAHLLLLNFPGSRPPSTRQVYVPKIFGFRQYTPAGEEEGSPGSSKQVLLNKSDGARMIADATLRKQQMTSVLDREGAQILVSPDGKRLEVFNEDFLDLEELLAQQKSGSHKRGKK